MIDKKRRLLMNAMKEIEEWHQDAQINGASKNEQRELNIFVELYDHLNDVLDEYIALKKRHAALDPNVDCSDIHHKFAKLAKQEQILNLESVKRSKENS